MVRTILTQLGALAALVVSVVLAGDFPQLADSPWKSVIVALAVVVAVSLAAWEVFGTWRNLPIRYRGKKRDANVLKYMTKLLSFDGQCVMSSNDLSWATGDAEHALIKKAREGSLTLIMPSPNKLSTDLEEEGANAHYYGNEEFKFLSRFTLVNASRADAWVAIGHGTNGEHTIREISLKEDPTVHLANDLVRLVKRTSPSGSGH